MSIRDDQDFDLPEGTAIGEYVVEARLGKGGFGTVYRAVQPVIGKRVAIKVLALELSSDPQIVSRFVEEARAVNEIRCRNIVDIFSFGTLPTGQCYFVMELLEGCSLEEHLAAHGRLSIDELLPILRGVARALAAAHARGIAHRDLKPDNVFLVFNDDGTIFPKLLDFGVAKLMGGRPVEHVTYAGVPIGTPDYMSPEQARGDTVDSRTDVYSFGVLVHQCLTGSLPFHATDTMGMLLQHLLEPPPRVTEIAPDLAQELDEPVTKMLEKHPDQRPRTIDEALSGLARAADEAGNAVTMVAPRSRTSSSAPPPPAPITMKPPEVKPRRRILPMALIAGFVVLAGVAAAYGGREALRGGAQPVNAQKALSR